VEEALIAAETLASFGDQLLSGDPEQRLSDLESSRRLVNGVIDPGRQLQLGDSEKERVRDCSSSTLLNIAIRQVGLSRFEEAERALRKQNRWSTPCRLRGQHPDERLLGL
jgi:hypothetical protein